VRWSEWLALGFFLWLAAAGWFRTLLPGRRWRLTVASLVMCGVVVAVATGAAVPVRDWAPPLYVLVGYFLSGLLFVSPSPAFEEWLVQWDNRILGDSIARFGRWPAWLLGYLDLIYVFCFLVVPGGFAVLVLTGHSALADRFWTIVLATEFGAFAPLAVVQSRPPWALDPQARARHAAIHRFASIFVRQATIGANTFPSGHAAASLAVALTVMDVVAWAGAILIFFAISISAACIVGRYHYVMDVAAGVVLAAAAWALVMI
jgi:membrane-associated phospholipid phosphatase